MNEEILELCEKYLTNINFVAKITNLCGVSLYCSASNDRANIHEQICDYFGLNHCDCNVLQITNNLDKSIGFDIDNDYSTEEISLFANKLYKKLLEAQNDRD